MHPPTLRLLSATRLVLQWAIAVTIFVTLGGAILAAATFFDSGLIEAMQRNPRVVVKGMIVDLTPEQFLFAVRTAFAGAFVSCLLAVPMLRNLIGIIDSARFGDPFVPENGRRLRRIGWMLLGIHLAPVLAGIAVGLQLPHRIQFSVDAFASAMPGVLLVLLVFVLARVFEVGTTMRTELQETV